MTPAQLILIQQYIPLAKRIAARYSNSNRELYDEFLSEATLTLVEAVVQYDGDNFQNHIVCEFHAQLRRLKSEIRAWDRKHVPPRNAARAHCLTEDGTASELDLVQLRSAIWTACYRLRDWRLPIIARYRFFENRGQQETARHLRVRTRTVQELERKLAAETGRHLRGG